MSEQTDLPEVDADGDLVAAGRVDVVHLGLEGVAQSLVVGVLVVVQDDLLVQGVDVHVLVQPTLK